ncbi:DUF6404 family protein [Psychromarinibacter sp. S121]|uniref:DUF6404 family protein n=1 Tax=Psychromarinibacter sp. S121 TaxID=3415127 RepID=UPI003C7E0B26
MPSQDFQRRVQELNAQSQRASAAHAARRPAAPPAPGEPAPNRRARLERALWMLQQGGITGSFAYSPLFRALACVGIIIRPVHFWSPLPLALAFFAALCGIFWVTIQITQTIGVVPRPVARMIEAGPVVFCCVMGGLSVVYALWHKMQALRIGLPRWRDL